MSEVSCPAVLISAPASGQGKTSVTAAIARHHSRRGRRVRVFKTGPDFIDPMLLARASGQPVYQLDLFMGGLEHCRALLADAARDCDLLLVEGVMGLFDGQPSSADLAVAFGLPVLAVIDASAMAQTFGALAFGLAHYRSDLRVAGVVANRIGSPVHARLCADSLPPDLPLVAAIPRQAGLELPERHLGLVQAQELPDLDAVLDQWADVWAASVVADYMPPPVSFAAQAQVDPGQPLRGVRVAVARDAAFSFIYPANLDTLRALGAELLFFSPLQAQELPACDALWLPGGYPELHAPALAADRAMAAAIQDHHDQGKPLLAECGGLLYLLDALTDGAGQRHAMAGLLPGEATLQPRLQALGLQSVTLSGAAGELAELRGHSFHFSSLQTPLEAAARGQAPHGGRTAEAVYRVGRLTASYIHFYFPSNPAAVAGLFAPGKELP